MGKQELKKNPLSSQKKEDKKGRSIWQKPSLSAIGKLREIVQGGGKSPGGADQESFKPTGLG